MSDIPTPSEVATALAAIDVSRMRDDTRFSVPMSLPVQAPDDAGGHIAIASAVVSSPLRGFIVGIRVMMRDRDEFVGSPKALLAEINRMIPETERGGMWPKSHCWVTRRLDLVIEALEAVGFEVDLGSQLKDVSPDGRKITIRRARVDRNQSTAKAENHIRTAEFSQKGVEAMDLDWATPRRIVEGGRTTNRFEARCADCHRVTTTQADTADVGRIRKNFQAKGWTIEGALSLCPKCAADRRKPAHKQKVDEMVPQNVVKAISSTSSDSAELAEAARIVSKIKEVFDDGRYLDGWTDRKIATALNIAPAKVARAREMFIGPIKEDPAIAALRSEVEAVEDMLSGIKERLAALAEAA